MSRPTQPDLRFDREAQAEVINRLALELLQQAWLPIVLGDFNDFDGSDGSRDHIDSMPITNVLQIAKGMEPNNAGARASLVKVINRRAGAAIEKGEVGNAYNLLSDAVKMTPDDLMTNRNLALALLLAKKYSEAEQVLQAGESSAPSTSPPGCRPRPRRSRVSSPSGCSPLPRRSSADPNRRTVGCALVNV